MQDTRLIAVDLDGTLLNSHSEISPYTLNVLRKAIDRGIYIAISSGRRYSAAMDFSLQIAKGQPVICANGSMAVCGDPIEVAFCECLVKEQLRAIVNVLEREKCYYHVYCDDGSVMESRTGNPFLRTKDHVFAGEIFTGDEMPKYAGDGTLKVICFSEDLEQLARIRQSMEKIGGMDLCASWWNNLEMTAKGSNKGEALRALAAHMGIPIEQTMAFGDNENDLQMLSAAGFAVVMGNAEDSVKEHADYVTGTNDEDGVAKAIEKLIFCEE